MRLEYCPTDLRLTRISKLSRAPAAGGSRLAEDLPEDLFGPTLAPQWSHDGKGAALLVRAASLHHLFLVT